MPKIYEEIKQHKPLRSPGQVAAITIFRTADVVRHAVERSLSPFGLSNEQYNVLRILRGAGEGGLPTLEIANRMLSRSPNITRLIDRLIAKKLARRSRPKEDRRVVIVSVTPQGLELLAHLDGVVDGPPVRIPQKKLLTTGHTCSIVPQYFPWLLLPWIVQSTRRTPSSSREVARPEHKESI